MPKFTSCWFWIVMAIGWLSLPTPSSHAQSVWNTTDGAWSSSASWSPSSVPVSGGSASLIFGGSTGYTSTNDLGDFSLNQIRFTHSSGTVSLVSSPAASALTLTNSAESTLPSISVEGAGNVTLSTPLTWAANSTATHSGSGTLLLNGTQTYATGTKQTLLNSGTGTITLADAITYAGAGTNTGLVLNVINNNAGANSFNIGNLGNLTNFTLNIGGTGTVRFAGSTGGDLLSASAVLNVQSGATFDFNGNGESFGAMSGAGTVRTTVNVNVSSAGWYTYSGQMTGAAGNLTVSGASHTLVLSNATSNYTGATAITAGKIIVSANAPSGSAGALGNATSEVLVGNTSGSGSSALLIDAPGLSIGRNIRLQSANTGVSTLGGLNTSGTATYSGNVTLGTNSAAAKGLTITAATGGTVEFTGNLLRATSATGATDTLIVTGGGTVALRGSNTFTGTTTVNAGTLQLNHSTNNNTKISSTAGLILNGGSISLVGNPSAVTVQAVTGTTLGNSTAPLGGGARIAVTSGLDQNATLNLGTITRNTGATADFATTNTGTGIAAITTSNGNNALNILGTYATFNRTDWAVNDGAGNIAALASGSYASGFGAGLHTSLAANTTLPSGGTTTGTLRLTGAATVAFNATTQGTFTLAGGGILVTPAAGATAIGATNRRGTLSSSTNELVIHQNSTAGALSIHSLIPDTVAGTSVIKSGDGNLILTGTNTYTGNTYINGGTVTVAAAANLGAVTTDIFIHGGTLALSSGGTLGTINSTNRVITIGPAGATFNFTGNQSIEGNGLVGTGALTLAGSGIVSVGSNGSSFSGAIIINNGALRMSSPQLNSAASVTVNSGGSYELNDDGTDTFSMAASGRFVINGLGLNGNGAIRLIDQTSTTSRADPRTTLDREIVLQSTARIQVDNGAVAGSLSQLTLTGNVTGSGNLIKSGTGVLVLSARDNSYTGDTQVENGTLRMNLGNDRLPTSTNIVLGSGANSGTLQLNGYSQTVAGLSTAGTGTANAVIGGTSTANSLLEIKAVGSQTYTGTLGGTGVQDQHINNNVSFVKSGAGTFTLGSANTYSGTTTVAAGTLQIANANALGHGGTSLASGTAGTTVQTSSTLDLNGQSMVQEVITLRGDGVGGLGALVNNSTTPASIGNGIASLNVSSASTTGWSAGAGVTLDAPGTGTSATAKAVLGLSSSSLTLTNGGSGFGLAPVINVSGGSGAVVTALVGLTNTSFTIAAPVPGTTTSYSAAPNVTLQNGATGVAVLDGNGYVIGISITTPGSGFSSTPSATFAGGTTSFAGTNPTATGNNNNYTIAGLTIVNSGTGFTSTPTVSVTGGTGAVIDGNDGSFALLGFAMTQAGSGYTSAPSVSIQGGTASATANLTSVSLAADSSIGGSGDLTIHAPVSGAYSLTKVGAGTTVLAGVNTYTGTTTVTAGNLQVGLAGIGSSGQGLLTLQGSGTVLSGTGSVNAASIIQGTLKPGDQGGATIGSLNVGTLSFAPTTLNTVAELQVTGSTSNSNLAFDTLHVSGDLTLNNFSRLVLNGSSYNAAVGDTFQLIDWGGLLTEGGFSWGSNMRTGADADLNEGNFDLPDISGTGFWNIALNGGALTLTVVTIVPEPGKFMLFSLSMIALLMRRRRSM
ncbi:MAG: autotransporter-associated beta strand repeat-containing protein [Verrucomicrobiota bacterium]